MYRFSCFIALQGMDHSSSFNPKPGNAPTVGKAPASAFKREQRTPVDVEMQTCWEKMRKQMQLESILLRNNYTWAIILVGVFNQYLHSVWTNLVYSMYDVCTSTLSRHLPQSSAL